VSLLQRRLAAARGTDAEDLALAFLQKQGLQVVARNWRAKGGELDLVMLHGAVLVFVEVRARGSAHFGGALGSITATKRQRIVHAAQQYLGAHPQHAEREVRFDVVCLDGSAAPEWLAAAFD
jgi:putative endonuclease